MTPDAFISKIAPAAVADMRRTGVPASLTIAQAILESNWGESGLTKRANNLFGIKGTGPAGSIVMSTKEFMGGKWITVDASFRKYHSWDESIADHSKLILNGTKDNPKRYHGVIKADYRTACHAIYQGGYATDPGYPQKLINLIEKYQLMIFDRGENELELQEYQWNMLGDTLNDLFKKGVISDFEWAKKAYEKRLTVSELAWLNMIVLSRTVSIKGAK